MSRISAFHVNRLGGGRGRPSVAAGTSMSSTFIGSDEGSMGVSWDYLVQQEVS